MRDGDAGEVVLQAAERAAFVVIKAEALLELAVVVLNAPAQLREADQGHDRRLGREVGEPVLDRLVLALRPFSEQPPLGQHPVAVALGVVGGADAQRDELATRQSAVSKRKGQLTARV